MNTIRRSNGKWPYLFHSKRHDPSRAFTLVELLITAAIGSIIFAAGAILVTTHIRSTTAAEVAQRVRDDSNRLSYFIQTEANESVLVRTGQARSGCAVSGNSLFSFDIPRPDGVAGGGRFY